MCALIQDGFPDQMFPQRRRLDALRGVCHHRTESARLRAWPISRHQSVVHPSGSTPSPGMLTPSVEKRQQPHCNFSYLCNTALRWNTTSKTYPGVSITHSIYSQDFTTPSWTFVRQPTIPVVIVVTDRLLKTRSKSQRYLLPYSSGRY